jgi:hypothetical protein
MLELCLRGPSPLMDSACARVMGSYWDSRTVISACDQTSPNRRKGWLLCGAKTRAGGCCGAGQGALPLPRWQIDGPEDAGRSCAYRRDPAPALARASRDGSGSQE